MFRVFVAVDLATLGEGDKPRPDPASVRAIRRQVSDPDDPLRADVFPDLPPDVAPMVPVSADPDVEQGHAFVVVGDFDPTLGAAALVDRWNRERYDAPPFRIVLLKAV